MDGRATERLRRKYGNETTRIVGHFASREALAQAGERIVHIGGFQRAREVGVYFNAARMLSNAELGQYDIKIDTDCPGNSDEALLIGVGQGNSSNNLWEDFYKVLGTGLDRFNDAYLTTMSYRRAASAAKLAMQSN